MTDRRPWKSPLAGPEVASFIGGLFRVERNRLGTGEENDDLEVDRHRSWAI